VGPRAQRNLKAGSVITIERGIYMPGLGGVRIEDLIVVGQHGAEVLTRSPKQLLEIA
jgi:Xaa-Pro aminopeptidase